MRSCVASYWPARQGGPLRVKTRNALIEHSTSAGHLEADINPPHGYTDFQNRGRRFRHAAPTSTFGMRFAYECPRSRFRHGPSRVADQVIG